MARCTKKMKAQQNKFARAARACKGKSKGKFRSCMRAKLGGRSRRRARRSRR